MSSTWMKKIQQIQSKTYDRFASKNSHIRINLKQKENESEKSEADYRYENRNVLYIYMQTI